MGRAGGRGMRAGGMLGRVEMRRERGSHKCPLLPAEHAGVGLTCCPPALASKNANRCLRWRACRSCRLAALGTGTPPRPPLRAAPSPTSSYRTTRAPACCTWCRCGVRRKGGSGERGAGEGVGGEGGAHQVLFRAHQVLFSVAWQAGERASGDGVGMAQRELGDGPDRSGIIQQLRRLCRFLTWRLPMSDCFGVQGAVRVRGRQTSR